MTVLDGITTYTCFSETASDTKFLSLNTFTQDAESYLPTMYSFFLFLPSFNSNPLFFPSIHYFILVPETA